jgi:hypothetical protein
MSGNTTNSAALASPVYNPSVDDVSLKLFNAMSGEYPADLVEQYRQTIMAMPTTNAYAALITNPRACDISQAQTGISDLLAGLDDKLDDALLYGTPVPDPDGTGSGLPGEPGYQPSDDQIAEAQAWQTAMPALADDISQATDALDTYQDHSDRLLSNLPAILGLIQTALGLATARNGLQNPCFNLPDFLGSLLQRGQGLLACVLAGVKSAALQIGSGVDVVKAAMARAKACVMQILAMIEAEIMALIRALIDAARMSLANLLKSLPSDPCLKFLLGTITSGAATSLLSSIK